MCQKHFGLDISTKNDRRCKYSLHELRSWKILASNATILMLTDSVAQRLKSIIRYRADGRMTYTGNYAASLPISANDLSLMEKQCLKLALEATISMERIKREQKVLVIWLITAL